MSFTDWDKSIVAFNSPQIGDIVHWGRSKRDGAPGVGTGNWRRGGQRRSPYDKYLDKSGRLNQKGINKVVKMSFKSDRQAAKAANIVRAALASTDKWDKLHSTDSIGKRMREIRKAVYDILGKNANKKDWTGASVNDYISGKLGNRILFERGENVTSNREARRRHFY